MNSLPGNRQAALRKLGFLSEIYGYGESNGSPDGGMIPGELDPPRLEG